MISFLDIPGSELSGPHFELTQEKELYPYFLERFLSGVPYYLYNERDGRINETKDNLTFETYGDSEIELVMRSSSTNVLYSNFIFLRNEENVLFSAPLLIIPFKYKIDDSIQITALPSWDLNRPLLQYIANNYHLDLDFTEEKFDLFSYFSNITMLISKHRLAFDSRLVVSSYQAPLKKRLEESLSKFQLIKKLETLGAQEALSYHSSKEFDFDHLEGLLVLNKPVRTYSGNDLLKLINLSEYDYDDLVLKLEGALVTDTYKNHILERARLLKTNIFAPSLKLYRHLVLLGSTTKLNYCVVKKEMQPLLNLLKPLQIVAPTLVEESSRTEYNIYEPIWVLKKLY